MKSSLDLVCLTSERTNSTSAGKSALARIPLASLGSALLALGIATPALSQSAGANPRAQLEEIVVTASRRVTGLQDTPISMTAISASDLEERGIADFKELTKMTSGLHLERRSFSGSQSIRIRGVGSPPGGALDPSVGVLVDGVYQVRPGFIFSELSDLERVEVLRGPQGTTFGRNTTAGVIALQTADPDTGQVSGNLQAVVGNLDTVETRGFINIPLIENSLAIRLSGFYAERDGHVENVFTGRNTQENDREGGRFKLLWEGNDFVRLEWMSEMTSTTGYMSGSRVKQNRDNIISANARPDLAGQPWEVVAAELGKTLPPIALGKSAQDIEDRFDDDMERHVLTLDVSLPGHNLQSISAYEEFDAYLLQDRDQTILALAGVINDSKTIAWSQELLLTSEWEGPWDYTAGVFFQQENLSSPSTLFNGPDLAVLQAAAPGAPPIVSITQKEAENRAVFGNLGYAITDSWTLRGGVRYTEDEKDQFSTLEIPGLPTVVAVDDDRTFYEITWTAKLEYHFANGNLAYLSVDRGFKSGGFNRQNTICSLTGGQVGCLGPELLNFDEETTDNIEIGVKSEWLDIPLRANGAVLYQTFDNFQAVELLQAEGISLVRNAAEVESVGLEFDVLAIATDHLTINGSATWARTEYGAFESAPCATPASPGCVDGVQDLSGRRLDGAPLLTANIGVEYRGAADGLLPGINGLEWFARGDAVFRSDTNLHVALSDTTNQGSYTLYSARGGLETADSQWRVTFWAENLFDKDYAVSAREDIGGVSRFKGLPLTWGATVDWNF